MREAAKNIAAKERQLASEREKHAAEVRAKLGALVIEEIAERPIDVAGIQRALGRAKIFVSAKEIANILERLVALGRARKTATMYVLVRAGQPAPVAQNGGLRAPARLSEVLAGNAKNVKRR
ncbi:MAG: hypothetical protein JST00_16035 [Deltaproteobacteria bacterium]|nr:hypothetical protein [Deltaproteobacteria bacterium]